MRVTFAVIAPDGSGTLALTAAKPGTSVGTGSPTGFALMAALAAPAPPDPAAVVVGGVPIPLPLVGIPKPPTAAGRPVGAVAAGVATPPPTMAPVMGVEVSAA